jgi:hypothetical protein
MRQFVLVHDAEHRLEGGDLLDEQVTYARFLLPVDRIDGICEYVSPDPESDARTEIRYTGEKGVIVRTVEDIEEIQQLLQGPWILDPEGRDPQDRAEHGSEQDNATDAELLGGLADQMRTDDEAVRAKAKVLLQIGRGIFDSHIASCAQCAGPNDGCEYGQELENYLHELEPMAAEPEGDPRG